MTLEPKGTTSSRAPERKRIIIGPFSLLRKGWEHRALLALLIKREIELRYKGSLLGILWTLLIPILMLCVYTFVFTVIFGMRWGTEVEHKGQFALVLFAGLTVFGIFSECISRAPGLLLENVSYIKKVLFPLEIMPFVILGAALFNAMISLAVLLLGHLIIIGLPPLTVILLPVVLLPILFLVLGLSWFLSSLGIFIRDMRPIVGVFVTIAMFLSPVFYPLNAVPAGLRPYMYLNPLTISLEHVRSVLIFGKVVTLSTFGVSIIFSYCIAWLGYAWFLQTKKGFADVV